MTARCAGHPARLCASPSSVDSVKLSSCAPSPPYPGARVRVEYYFSIPEMPTLFDIRDLAKIYRMGEVEVHALRGVDLALQEGELLVLLGPSGSGKSTLLNILGGLDTPTSGSIAFKDHDLSHADEAALTRYRREHVGFVFQFYNLLPVLTAEKNVELPLLLTPLSKAQRAKHVATALDHGTGCGVQAHHLARFDVDDRGWDRREHAGGSHVRAHLPTGRRSGHGDRRSDR